MPGLDGELGVVAVADGLPARSHGSGQIWLRQATVDGFRWNAINARAKRLIGTKMIGGVRRSYIDLDRLPRALRHQKYKGNYKPSESRQDSVQAMTPPIQVIGVRNITTLASRRNGQ